MLNVFRSKPVDLPLEVWCAVPILENERGKGGYQYVDQTKYQLLRKGGYRLEVKISYPWGRVMATWSIVQNDEIMDRILAFGILNVYAPLKSWESSSAIYEAISRGKNEAEAAWQRSTCRGVWVTPFEFSTPATQNFGAWEKSDE